MSTRTFFLSIFLCASVRAQFGTGIALHGQIESEGGASLTRDYVVDISECASVASLGRSTLSPDNRFEFRDLKPGCKKVSVLSSDERQVIHEEQVFVTGEAAPLIIRMPGEKRVAATSATVSADQLRHPVPAKVLHNVVGAEKLADAGKTEEAASKLRAILERYPSIWQAQLNLGVLEMKLGHPGEALTRFLSARQFQPRSAIATANAAVALVVLHRVEDADQLAREALALDPSNTTAHLILKRIHPQKTSE